MKHLFITAFMARSFAMTAAVCSGMISLKLFKSYLDLNVYGVIVVAIQVLSYMAPIDGGFRTTVNRLLLAEKDPDKRDELIRFLQVFNSHLYVIILAVSALVMTAYQFSPNAWGFETPAFFLAMAIAGTISLVVNIQGGLLVGLGAQSIFFLATGITSLLNLGSLALALRWGVGAWAFPISTIAGALGTCPIILYSIHRYHPGFKLFSFVTSDPFWSRFHEFKHDAWVCFRTQISIMFLYTTDLVIIGLLCRPEEAALYGVLTRFFSIVRMALQTMAEVGWPLIAQRAHDAGRFSKALLQFNALIYGGVMASLCVTLGPFVTWYMGEKWTIPSVWIYLLAIRFIIPGVSSPASYHLFGIGEFKLISRPTERELAVGLIFATALGFKFQTAGVIAGFIFATTVGSLFSYFLSYAKILKISFREVVLNAWGRTAVAWALSYFAALKLLELFGGGVRVIFAGITAASIPVTLACVLMLPSLAPAIKLALSKRISVKEMPRT